MKFWLYIKSHCEAPDLEDEGEFKTKVEAVNFWFERYGRYGWNKDLLAKNIAVEKQGKWQAI